MQASWCHGNTRRDIEWRTFTQPRDVGPRRLTLRLEGILARTRKTRNCPSRNDRSFCFLSLFTAKLPRPHLQVKKIKRIFLFPIQYKTKQKIKIRAPHQRTFVMTNNSQNNRLLNPLVLYICTNKNLLNALYVYIIH